jgi:hypothetical protein
MQLGAPEERLDVGLLGLHRDIAEPPGFSAAQGDLRNVTVLKLILVDDCHGVRTAGIMASMVAIIEIVVDENTGVVIPAQWTPAAVIISPVPMDPSRAPGAMRYPIPAQAEPPAPAAVMVDGPAPRLRGDPGPTAQRIPIPVTVIVRPPVRVGNNVGHPDVAVGPFIGPRAVVGQLVLIVIELGGQIPFGGIASLDGIPVFVPSVEIVPSVSEARLRAELPIGGHQPLPAADELGTAFAGRLRRTFKHRDLGFGVASGIEPVEALFQDVE